MSERSYSDWRIHDTHFIAGVSLAPGFGFVFDYATETASAVDPAFLFSLRIGALFSKRTELAVEISPVTWFPTTVVDPVLQMNLTIGNFNHLGGDFYWPTRFGLGFAAVNLPNELFTQRLDLIGVAYNWSHFIFELMLPSVRHGTDLDAYSVFDFHFGVQTSYAF